MIIIKNFVTIVIDIAIVNYLITFIDIENNYQIKLTALKRDCGS